MSTNKTENYGLHAWVPGDDFMLSEINANFAAIDTVLPRTKGVRVVMGYYTGNGESERHITLDFHPKMVLVMMRPNVSFETCILFMDGASDEAEFGMGNIEDNGFKVIGSLNRSLTHEYTRVNPYRYVAFWWEE